MSFCESLDTSKDTCYLHFGNSYCSTSTQPCETNANSGLGTLSRLKCTAALNPAGQNPVYKDTTMLYHSTRSGSLVFRPTSNLHMQSHYSWPLLRPSKLDLLLCISPRFLSETCHLNCQYRLPSNDAPTFSSCSAVDLLAVYSIC